MGLEIITQPQLFLGGLTALGPGIKGLTEQYPLLTTYYAWTSTAIEEVSAFPIPLAAGSIYDGPGKEAAFIVTVGGVVQSPTEYIVDPILRKITFNSTVSADIEVAVTQLATAAPSSQSFEYVESINSNFTNLTAGDIVATNLVVTSLTALSSILEVTDIKVREVSGFSITGDLYVQDTTDTVNLVAGNATISFLSAIDGYVILEEVDTDLAIIDNELVTNSVITNLTATNIKTTNLTATDVIITNNTIVGNDIVVSGDIAASGDITGYNLYGNLDGSIQINNQSIDTKELREYFTLKAAVSRSVRNIFVTSGGINYTSAPTVVISVPPETWGEQAQAQAYVSLTGQVTSIQVTNVGSGYTSDPSISFTGGGGSNARAVALVDGNPLGENRNKSNGIPSRYNTAVLGNDGNLYGWGENTANSELGIGAVAVNSTPTPYKFYLAPLSGTEAYVPRVVKFWRSHNNTYVLDQNGNLWGCGLNGFGQLGLGDTTTRKFLTRIPPAYFDNNPVISFAVSDGAVTTTCLAKTTRNEAYGWGHNTTHGALGIGTVVDQTVPAKLITTTRNTALLSLSTSVDQIYCYGGQFNSTAATGTLTFITFASGQVFAAGNNTAASGHLGIANATNPITTLSSVRLGPNALSGIRSIVGTGNPTSSFVTFFLDYDGTLYSTGYNLSGALGLNNIVESNIRSVSAVTTNIKSVFTGNDLNTTAAAYTYAIKNNGNIFSWGRNDNTIGQLGYGTSIVNIQNFFTPIQLLSAINDINNTTAESAATRYVMSSGGDGITWSVNSIADIAVLQRSAVILRNDGSLYVLGYNIGGQLGTGDTTSRYLLQRVPSLPKPVKYIALAGAVAVTNATTNSPHLIAVLEDGSVYITGNNSNRQSVYSSQAGNLYTFAPVSINDPSQIV